MVDEDGFVRLLRQQAGDMALDQNRQEIERAIAGVKRREADKELMRQFYRAKARSLWSDRRWRRYSEWLRKRKEEGRDGCHERDLADGELRQNAGRGEPDDSWWRLGPMGRMRRDCGRRSARPGTDVARPGPSDGWRR